MLAIGDKADFFTRLAEAIAWCLPRASVRDPRHSLRSAELFPDLLAPDRASVVRQLCQARHIKLSNSRLERVRTSEDLMGGRLLVYFPERNLADGAAELESRGFFDGNNIPAWETWVGLFQSDSQDPSQKVYLVAYVPPALLEIAGIGIEANPELCINWLIDTDTPIGNILRSDGWVF